MSTPGRESERRIQSAPTIQRDLVMIGASAGGVDALIRLVRELPGDLPAAVLVVLHLPARVPSQLASILARAGPLPVETARDEQPLTRGQILVAPPDQHLAVRDGVVRVTGGPAENLHRPSVDVLFRSGAVAFDGRAAGIVLSGALDDGTSGMRAIHAMGGLTIVQSPEDALVSGMPLSVFEAIHPDAVLPADEIGRQLPALLVTPAPRHAAPPAGFREQLRQEVSMSLLDPGAFEHTPHGDPSPFGCPACGGVLWEVKDGDRPAYRCRVGHAFSPRSLLAAEDDGLEDALWAALRALEEQESMSRRMLDRGSARSARFRERLVARREEAARRSAVLREFLLRPVGAVDDEEAPSRAAAVEAEA